jgi:alkyl hydroperoxide reductase subunit D
MTNPSAIERLKGRIPDHARDLKINLGAIAAATALTPQQAWGTAVAAAHTSRNPEVIAEVEDAAAAVLSPEALAAARGAASIMGMNNIYYRFVHIMGDESEYAQMPARLRMQIIGKPGVDAVDFELWCLAASAITGCERCVRTHDQSVRERGGSAEAVHEAVRIAAIVHAVALTLTGAPVEQRATGSAEVAGDAAASRSRWHRSAHGRPDLSFPSHPGAWRRSRAIGARGAGPATRSSVARRPSLCRPIGSTRKDLAGSIWNPRRAHRARADH